MWQVCSLGNTTVHFRECEDNRFDIVRCVPAEIMGGPGNWFAIEPLFTIIDADQQLSRMERLLRAVRTRQTVAAGVPFTVQCGQLRRYSRSYGYDPRWNAMRPNVVLPHGRNDPNLWIVREFRAVFPHLPDAWRAVNPVHAWRHGVTAVPVGGTTPRLQRAEQVAARKAADAAVRRLKEEGEQAAKADRDRAREFAAVERKQEIFARRIAREKKWAEDKKAREDAAAAHKRAVAKNPTLRWRHARRADWKPPADYAVGGRRRNKKKS